MFICASNAILQGALDFLRRNNVDYSITFEGMVRENCKFKINFNKEIDSFAFKLKYSDIIERYL